jgi:hypothetical protein
MGCCMSTKEKSNPSIIRHPGQHDGGTGGAEANDLNDIVIEVRPGDLPHRNTPLKLFNEDNSAQSSIPSHRGSSRRRYP